MSKLLELLARPMYHGTREMGGIDEFRTPAQFTPNRKYAQDIIHGGEGRIIEARLSMQNPADLRAMHLSPSDPNFAAIAEQLKAQGYDGAFYRDDAWIAFDPKQITQVPEGSPAPPRGRRFQDLAAEGANPFEGAYDPETGLVRLHHYAHRDLTEVDPTRAGEGLDARRHMNQRGDPDYVPRSYFGIPAAENPYKPERGLGRSRHVGDLPAEDLYDYRADPEGLRARARGEISEHYPSNLRAERLIRDAGYQGYFVDDSHLGKVAAVYNPVKVQRGSIDPKLLALLGTGALGFEGAQHMQLDEGARQSLGNTWGDVKQLGGALVDLATDPEAWKSGAEAVGGFLADAPAAAMSYAMHPEESLPRIAGGAALGLTDVGNTIGSLERMLDLDRNRYLLETGQSLAPWSQPDMRWAPRKVLQEEMYQRRREEAAQKAEQEWSPDPVTRFGVNWFGP